MRVCLVIFGFYVLVHVLRHAAVPSSHFTSQKSQGIVKLQAHSHVPMPPLTHPVNVVLPLLQAYGFYDDIIRLLDFYVNLVPADARTSATKLLTAKRASLPKFLFKEDSLLMKERVATS